jgi:hypothetical protein
MPEPLDDHGVVATSEPPSRPDLTGSLARPSSQRVSGHDRGAAGGPGGDDPDAVGYKAPIPHLFGQGRALQELRSGWDLDKAPWAMYLATARALQGLRPRCRPDNAALASCLAKAFGGLRGLRGRGIRGAPRRP